MSTDTVEQVQATTYYLMTDGDRAVIHREVMEGFSVYGDPVQALSRGEALQKLATLRDEMMAAMSSVKLGWKDWALRDEPVEEQPEDDDGSDGLFRSMSEALRFAYSYAGQQSPHTPMAKLMQGGSIGSGRGLVGGDGAGQAGMILGSVERLLSTEQRLVVLVRFGASIIEECSCCGARGHAPWWRDAVAALSLTEELRDLPKPIREAVVMKTVGRQRLRVQSQADGYEVTDRQIRRRVNKAHDYFGRIENTAMGILQSHFGADLLGSGT